ncbi:MAG: glycosyltransferase [Bacteroidetes bacterium]|nr:glycosyltransferase [Bacteroidota bacterium]
METKPKRILYLTFYFEPDLCAGSFRNSPLAKTLASKFGEDNQIDIISTQPNRYSTFQSEAPELERRGNMTIHRIAIPTHQSGFMDQIKSFYNYYSQAQKIARQQKYDLVFASSSRLFTAYLGYKIARKKKAPLYLDIRDIFVDTMKDVLQNKLIKSMVLPILKYVEKKTFSDAKHINLISGGFKPYFAKYTRPKYSEFPNGIDDAFLEMEMSSTRNPKPPYKIVYAGNMGEGQGLHKIIPQAAKALEGQYEFLVIGDGGAKAKLEEALAEFKPKNVELHPPVKRSELFEIYKNTDFFFLHLNDYDAFKKVLPSKIFEMGAYNIPIIAGVGGFANEFIRKNVPNSILFDPGDVQSMVEQLKNYTYHEEERIQFKQDFTRAAINDKLAASILGYLS